MKNKTERLSSAEALAAWKIMGDADAPWTEAPFHDRTWDEERLVTERIWETVRRIVCEVLIQAGAESERAARIAKDACGRDDGLAPEVFNPVFAFYRDPVECDEWYDPLSSFLCNRELGGMAMAGFAAVGMLALEDEGRDKARDYLAELEKMMREGPGERFLNELCYFCDWIGEEDDLEDLEGNRERAKDRLLSFLWEWRECAAGRDVASTRYLRLLRDFQDEEFTSEGLEDDAGYLAMLPLLSLLLYAGRQNGFRCRGGGKFYALAVAQTHETRGARAPEVLSGRRGPEEEAALRWSLDVLCGLPARSESPVLSAYPGWKAQGERILLSQVRVFCDAGDESEERPILLPGAGFVVAGLVAEALLAEGEGEDARGEAPRRPPQNLARPTRAS